MSYAVKVTGRISVLDIETGLVVPPVTALLGCYATRKEAESALERMQQSRSRNLKEVVEV